jgi:hypothetical protein
MRTIYLLIITLLVALAFPIFGMEEEYELPVNGRGYQQQSNPYTARMFYSDEGMPVRLLELEIKNKYRQVELPPEFPIGYRFEKILTSFLWLGDHYRLIVFRDEEGEFQVSLELL